MYSDKKSEKFIVYYGREQEERLLDYDLLILEPSGHTDEKISFLKKRGKTVIAYLSIVEIRKQDEFFMALNDDDFIKINNEIVMNNEYDTFYMDISKEKIQNLLFCRAKSLLNSGYDGIFLDTVGDIEYLDVNGEYKEKLLQSVCVILGEIKSAFPNSVVIQNNGIASVCDYTTPYLDGICVENPPFRTFNNLRWTISAFKKLDELKTKHGIEIFLLQEINAKNNRLNISQFVIKRIAMQKGYLCYDAKRYYKI